MFGRGQCSAVRCGMATVCTSRATFRRGRSCSPSQCSGDRRRLVMKSKARSELSIPAGHESAHRTASHDVARSHCASRSEAGTAAGVPSFAERRTNNGLHKLRAPLGMKGRDADSCTDPAARPSDETVPLINAVLVSCYSGFPGPPWRPGGVMGSSPARQRLDGDASHITHKQCVIVTVAMHTGSQK